MIQKTFKRHKIYSLQKKKLIKTKILIKIKIKNMKLKNLKFEFQLMYMNF